MAVAAPSHYTAPRHDMVPFLPAKARRVLDVGCGTGSFGALLRDTRSDVRLWAVEIDAAGAAEARRAGAYEEVVEGGFPEVAERLPAASFDCIFFNDVLEHLVEPGEALVTAAGLLRDGGAVVASIPNVRCIDVVKPLVLSGEWRYEDYGLLDRTHLRFFTKTSMTRLFVDHGFRIERIEGINGRNGWKASVARHLLGRRIDEFLFQQYVVVARP